MSTQVQVHFLGIRPNADFEAVLLTHAIRANASMLLYVGEKGRFLSHLDEHSSTGLFVYANETPLDADDHEKLRVHDAIKTADFIIWGWNIVQLLKREEEVNETDLNVALQYFIGHRLGLRTYTGKMVDKTGKKDKSELIRKALYERIVGTIQQEADRGEHSLRLLNLQIKQHRNMLTTLERERAAMMDKHAALLQVLGSEEAVAEMEAEKKVNAVLNDIVKLHESGAVKDIEFRVNELQIHTGMVYLQYPTKKPKQWPMGEFVIHIPWTKGGISITQDDTCVKSPIRLPNTIPHPHVGEHGSVCMGSEVGTLIRRYMNEGEFTMAINILLQFLEVGYNPKDRFQGLTWSDTIAIDGKRYYDPRMNSGWYDPELYELAQSWGWNMSQMRTWVDNGMKKSERPQLEEKKDDEPQPVPAESAADAG